jgi:anhydro-N-acetylmuramic acid kinase
VATAATLTSAGIWKAFHDWVHSRTKPAPVDCIVSGGGAHNEFILATLRILLEHYNCTVTTTDATGFPAEAKEAAAFALLAYQTWRHRPGNIPSATGATQPAILGQVTYAK